VGGGGPGYKADGVGDGSWDDMWRVFGLLGSGVWSIDGLKEGLEAGGSGPASAGGSGPLPVT